MASEIDALLARVDDPALRSALTEQFDRLRKRRQFGLVFEEHLPERVALPGHPVRRGSKVAPRDDADSDPCLVERVEGGIATVVRPDGSAHEHPVDNLVTVAEFGEPIYPGLKHLGSVERSGDKPFHTVIKGENHHALEALQFTHAGKIDCIYIDPPYNTGARDWQYNNDYVDGDDAYRHSKWLAMMQRRLELAKRLLNPDNSVLVVAIDENELHRLAMLIDQGFPAGRRQVVTSVITPGGTSRSTEFSRVEEYLLFVFIGDAAVSRTHDSMLGGAATSVVAEGDLWEIMVRRGNGVIREQRPRQFYPVFIDVAEARIVDVGEPIPHDSHRSAVPARPGLETVWPMKPKNVEGFWQLGPDSLREALARGTAKADYLRSRRQWTVKYMKAANAAAVRDGRIRTVGRRANGDLEFQIPSEFSKVVTPKTVWFRTSHDASVHGARLLTDLIGQRRFPFPKSVYAVEDAIRFCTASKPDAVVLDFFSGSGTTAHAVARLNKQDGGRRISISVTNNEVSDAEAKKLTADGHRPGDPEWEALGIFEHVTRPRITAAITGLTPDGDPIKGDYKFTDEFPMADGFEENVEFLELEYLAADDIELDLAFAGISPLLWMRAGSRGPIIGSSVDEHDETLPYAVTDVYGVLFQPDQWRPFVAALSPDVRTVFIVTDSASEFASVAGELPADVETVRLYQNYLATFAINRATDRTWADDQHTAGG